MARRQEAVDSLLPQIRSTVGRLVLSGPLSIERVAESLSTSTRSLQRHLASRNQTFRDLVCSAREEIASVLLSETELPVSAIAERLGYRTQSSFTRAFARWTGQSPTHFRRTVKLARNGQCK